MPQLDSSQSAFARRKRPAHHSIPTGSYQAKRLRVESLNSNRTTPGSMKNESVGHAMAERWFDDTSKDASALQHVPYQDNDPPFYLRKTPSDESSILAVRSDRSVRSTSLKVSPTGRSKYLLSQMDTGQNSNSEDFRSVIDDLTITNKKLRKRLKKYENLHCSHLQEEKLFELRIHGLAAHQKRELEETLRNFASNLEEACPPEGPAGTSASAQVHPLKSTSPLKPLHNPSSSSTSISKPLDSAYASMSGQCGGPQSQTQAQNSLKPSDLSRGMQSSLQNVTSYLHDIPEALMPKQAMLMSDRSKSKAVVRRLEQIFTGRGEVSRKHRQTHQQQEVSQSAAKADRNKAEAREKRTWHEGTREAHILSGSAELQVDNVEDANLRAGSRESSRGSRQVRKSRSSSFEQRPTRPLDLDLYRAQIPSDNMEYIRHLGLASPSEGSNIMADGNDGWVYLNLLISMAQLHTLNVTSEFIRKAVADVSEKFELSPDGTKVKWLGGSDGTRMSSDGDDSEDQPDWKSSVPNVAASKRSSLREAVTGEEYAQQFHPTIQTHLAESSAASEIGAKRRPVPLGDLNDSDGIFYKPLFFHTARSEDDEDTDLMSDMMTSADSRDFATAFNSGSNVVREGRSRLRGSSVSVSNGPIIFYTKARFCTDLSGDFTGARAGISYHRYTKHPVGSPSTCNESDGSEDDDKPNERRTTPSMDIDNHSTKSNRSALNLDDLRSSISDCLSDPKSPKPLEASGIGGIHPEDNFIVRVKIQHKAKQRRSPGRLPSSSNSVSLVRRALHNLPKSSDDFRDIRYAPGTNLQDRTKAEVVSAVTTKMPPSTLPPPSLIYLPFSSSSESSGNDSDDDTNDSSTPPPSRDSLNSRPSVDLVDTRPADFFISSSAGEDEEEEEEEEESSYNSTSYGSDDSSIDLLAHARELDPETILAREMEFDRNNISEHSVLRQPFSQPTLGYTAAAATAAGKAAGNGDGNGERGRSRTEKGGRRRWRSEDGDVDSMSVDRDELSELSVLGVTG